MLPTINLDGLSCKNRRTSQYHIIVAPTHAQLTLGNYVMIVYNHSSKIECRQLNSSSDNGIANKNDESLSAKREFTLKSLPKHFHKQYMHLHQMISILRDSIAQPQFQITFQDSQTVDIGISIGYTNDKIELISNDIKATLSSFESNKIVFELPIRNHNNNNNNNNANGKDTNDEKTHSKSLDSMVSKIKKTKIELKLNCENFQIFFDSNDDNDYLLTTPSLSQSLISNKNAMITKEKLKQYNIDFGLFTKMIKTTKQFYDKKESKNYIGLHGMYWIYDFSRKKLRPLTKQNGQNSVSSLSPSPAAISMSPMGTMSKNMEYHQSSVSKQDNLEDSKESKDNNQDGKKYNEPTMRQGSTDKASLGANKMIFYNFKDSPKGIKQNRKSKAKEYNESQPDSNRVKNVSDELNGIKVKYKSQEQQRQKQLQARYDAYAVKQSSQLSANNPNNRVRTLASMEKEQSLQQETVNSSIELPHPNESLETVPERVPGHPMESSLSSVKTHVSFATNPANNTRSMSNMSAISNSTMVSIVEGQSASSYKTNC